MLNVANSKHYLMYQDTVGRFVQKYWIKSGAEILPFVRKQ